MQLNKCFVYIRHVSSSSDLVLPINVTRSSANNISFIEHVVLYMSLDLYSYGTGYDYSDFNDELTYGDGDIYEWLQDPHPKRGDIQITLTSPHGTTSTLLPYRLYDFVNENGYTDWPFMTVHHWGENPVGTWTLRVKFRSSSGYVSASIDGMRLYGTTTTPQAVANIPARCDPACRGACSGPGPNNCDICRELRVAETQECVSSCPTGTHLYKNYCLGTPVHVHPPTVQPATPPTTPPTTPQTTPQTTPLTTPQATTSVPTTHSDHQTTHTTASPTPSDIYTTAHSTTAFPTTPSPTHSGPQTTSSAPLTTPTSPTATSHPSSPAPSSQPTAPSKTATPHSNTTPVHSSTSPPSNELPSQLTTPPKARNMAGMADEVENTNQDNSGSTSTNAALIGGILSGGLILLSLIIIVAVLAVVLHKRKSYYRRLQFQFIPLSNQSENV